jgi:hypothetical protein
MAKLTPALTLVVCLAGASALGAQEMTKPLGKWERKIGKNHIVINVEETRLHITYAGDKPGTLHADYAMTRDGLIYGVITSIECDEDEEADAIRTLFDAPFSFRFRIDEGALIIHDAKAHDAESKDDLWDGHYRMIRPSATRATVVPTSYSEAPPYMRSGPSPYTAPPPSPIAPSFSCPRETGNGRIISPNGTENFLNFWMGFSR